MRYEELGRELDAILERRRRISTDRYGYTQTRGNEEEHERLTKRAAEIRKEMRRVRYGSDE